MTTTTATTKTRTRTRATAAPRQEYQIQGIDALLGPSKPEENILDRTEDVEIKMIPLEDIRLPQSIRTYFDPDAIWQLVDSIQRNGVLEPIMVRPMPDGGYDLVYGKRRYRAAGICKLTHIPAIIRHLSDQEATEIAIIENLQREDLNPLEETEGILKLLSMKLSMPVDSIVALFNKAAHPKREIGDNVIQSEAWAVVVEVFKSIGKFAPESFRANRIPLLKLPPEIKAALEKGIIEYSKARDIAKVKNFEDRQLLLDRVITNDLSVREVKEMVADLDNKLSERPPQVIAITKGLRTLTRRMSSVKGPMPKRKVEQLDKLLTLIEKLLNE